MYTTLTQHATVSILSPGRHSGAMGWASYLQKGGCGFDS